MEKTNKTYDFIVVGAGPAGCTIAARLADSNAQPSVLLVEAGADDGTDITRRMSSNRFLQRLDKSQTWGYESEPTESLGDRGITLDRGKGLGGSSAVNFSCWTRGPKDDMDEMVRLTGDSSWEWERTVKRFRSIESFHARLEELPKGAENYIKSTQDTTYGTNGPLHISFPPEWDPEVTDMIDIWKENGYALNKDLSDGSMLGLLVTPSTEYRGVRVTAADVLFPRPSNLDIMTEAPVHCVLFDEEKRAVGVQLIDGRQLLASKEVIISAGAMDSPKILMHSGIGPGDQLTKFKIPLLHSLPGVGANYADHYHATFVWKRKDHTSLRPDFYSDPKRIEKAKRDWELYRTGEYVTLGTQLGMGFFKNDATLRSAEFQQLPEKERRRMQKPTIPTYELVWNVTAPMYYETTKKLPALSVVLLILLNSQGRGAFTLQSADPAMPLRFAPDFLRAPYDRRAAIETTRELLKVAGSEAFQRDNVEAVFAPASDSEEDILAFWRDTISSTWHMCGTVVMATKADGEGEGDGGDLSCVDTDFRVHGVKGLRVADMSIMPILPSAHTQTTAYQIGMIAAEKLIEEHGLSVRPTFKMFRTFKPRDTVTLFHKASSPTSMRVLTLLKQTAASASETATEDQAGDHTAHNETQRSRPEFELNVTEDLPTEGQLQTILEYVDQPAIPELVKGANSVTEALKKYKFDKESFQRPVVVDWNNGRAAIGGNESQILKMLNELKKD
ncbi:uncharacterized protein PpBr36_09760 [Pyricularia pennisetigena]|uniref:uncharacterized protein n=1 Tax=Pyricularia pennisetigena TaxID=1578925 RepID=UPI0011508DB5|nr:uncharacterized protein PpBr36_09760 [Pyricularia pennisetigena]TLS22460.1 hypothetical protein PpBr36_09760 [Pyricularia pennisetigena]